MTAGLPVDDRTAAIARIADRIRTKFPNRAPTHIDEHEIFSLTDKAVASWPESLSPEYVTFLTECIGLAVLAREINEERPLDPEEIRAYLAHSVSFLNSFVHP